MRCEEFWNILEKEGLTFFSGVPDSTFKDWMKFLADNHGKQLTNIMACNECEAVAIASGYHLATGKVGVVYMQNAGFGKTVNPLTSLADPEVYSIPMIMLIGWRGEPGKKDEPQHKKMGRVMIPLLETLEIPYEHITDDIVKLSRTISKVKKYVIKNRVPYALIIRKGMFEKYSEKEGSEHEAELSREEALKVVLANLKGDEAIVSTTGKLSRELFEYRESMGQGHQADFLTVGSMGCSVSIGLGIALQKKHLKVIVLDGDGAVIMQEGAMSTIGHYSPKNLYHIVFDNQSYDSTGGQPTTASTVDFEKLALANSYKEAIAVRTKEELNTAIQGFTQGIGPRLLIIKVRKGARKELGRPTTTPIENKEAFMDYLQSG